MAESRPHGMSAPDPALTLERSATALFSGSLHRVLVLIVLALLLVGCASTDQASNTSDTDPLANVPQDFQVDVQVFVGRKVDDQDRLERRAAHIVMLPDGALHAAQGDEVILGARPGLARILYRDQMADVWVLMRHLDFIGEGEPPTGPIRPPGTNEIVYVIEYTMNNDRRRIQKRNPSDKTMDGASTMLIRSLGALAWLRDAPMTDSAVAPIRYDYGPDPWARYRAIDSAQ